VKEQGCTRWTRSQTPATTASVNSLNNTDISNVHILLTTELAFVPPPPPVYVHSNDNHLQTLNANYPVTWHVIPFKPCGYYLNNININKLNVLITESIFVFLMILTVNSEYFRDPVCFCVVAKLEMLFRCRISWFKGLAFHQKNSVSTTHFSCNEQLNILIVNNNTFCFATTELILRATGCKTL
jgi:hypothetical protein